MTTLYYIDNASYVMDMSNHDPYGNYFPKYIATFISNSSEMKSS